MSRGDPIDAINRIVADLGYGRTRGSRIKHNINYWQAAGDFFSFGYTPWRQADGKFYALKYRSNRLVKKVAFGRRKTAKKRAYEWFSKRQEVLDSMAANRAEKPKKPAPTKAEIVQKKIAHCEGYIRRHSTRLKRTKTLIKKWEKKKRYYEKKARILKERN